MGAFGSLIYLNSIDMIWSMRFLARVHNSRIWSSDISLQSRFLSPDSSFLNIRINFLKRLTLMSRKSLFARSTV
jgi:hypothetical protein